MFVKSEGILDIDNEIFLKVGLAAEGEYLVVEEFGLARDFAEGDWRPNFASFHKNQITIINNSSNIICSSMGNFEVESAMLWTLR